MCRKHNSENLSFTNPRLGFTAHTVKWCIINDYVAHLFALRVSHMQIIFAMHKNIQIFIRNNMKLNHNKNPNI